MKTNRDPAKKKNEENGTAATIERPEKKTHTGKETKITNIAENVRLNARQSSEQMCSLFDLPN